MKKFLTLLLCLIILSCNNISKTQEKNQIEKFETSIGVENAESLTNIVKELDSLLKVKYPSVKLNEAYRNLIIISREGNAHEFYPNGFFKVINEIKSPGLERMLRTPPTHIKEVDSTLNLTYNFYNKRELIATEKRTLRKHFLKYSGYENRFSTAENTTLINLESEFFEALEDISSDNDFITGYLKTINELAEADGRQIFYTTMAGWILEKSKRSLFNGFDLENYFVKRIVVIELLQL
ncbi:hypothetical protein [Robertkochia aurantiaca]|uniref:hypothetical protein n=1 Tax=Robertkochia aurantiaca TaxID=2873700 RepID=UPI001CCCA12C|nr:hypothetical protein [Robertkochia sp. 3YJGBD-33]